MDRPTFRHIIPGGGEVHGSPRPHRLKIPYAREADHQSSELLGPISSWVAPQSEAES